MEDDTMTFEWSITRFSSSPPYLPLKKKESYFSVVISNAMFFNEDFYALAMSKPFPSDGIQFPRPTGLKEWNVDGKSF